MKWRAPRSRGGRNMYLWSDQAMARRLNWEKRNVDAKLRLSITDENEFSQNDLVARTNAPSSHNSPKKRVVVQFEGVIL
jgi:hypothetical protein